MSDAYCFRRWRTCIQWVPVCWCLPCRSTVASDPLQSGCQASRAESRQILPASCSTQHRSTLGTGQLSLLLYTGSASAIKWWATRNHVIYSQLYILHSADRCIPVNVVACYHHNTIIITHTHLMALSPRLPGWAGSRKVKPIWILLKQETVTGSGISWAICLVVSGFLHTVHYSIYSTF